MVSGRAVLKLLTGLGYEAVRQRGSHVRLSKRTPMGEHHVTVPLHDELARGTLNDILSSVALWNSISKEDLRERLR
ncbi:MAG: type II toxin-antitoxin system HicA family toxin [Methanobacteriota archaeon]